MKIVSPDGNYNYMYAPRLPIPCGTEEHAVVCQEEIGTGVVYFVARFDNSTTWFVNSHNPLQFTIHYYDGDQGRKAIFVMSYKNSTMSAKFISEDPVLIHNFDITGNEVVPAAASSITSYPSNCITFTSSVVVTMVTMVTMTPTACYPVIGIETELAVTHITTLTLPHSPSPPPLSSTEEEEEVRQKGLVNIHTRAGFNKLILFGTLVLLFLVLLLPVMAHRRRRSATAVGTLHYHPNRRISCADPNM